MVKLSTLGAALAFALLFTGPSIAAPAASEAADLLNRAAGTVQHMKVDPGFGPAQSLVNEAKAMFIVPSLVKGGFIFGAEGGSGVLLANNGGAWSDPAFYTMGSASFGLQAGLERTEVVMLIMSDRALQSITRGQFKFGADAGLTVVELERRRWCGDSCESLGRHPDLDVRQGSVRRLDAEWLRHQFAR